MEKPTKEDSWKFVDLNARADEPFPQGIQHTEKRCWEGTSGESKQPHMDAMAQVASHVGHSAVGSFEEAALPLLIRRVGRLS